MENGQMKTGADKYRDILDLPRPVSKKHPPMSLYDRAAQFAPFAALTGHDKTIRATEKRVEEMMQEDTEEWLDG